MRMTSLLVLFAVGCTDYGLTAQAEDVLAVAATAGEEEFVDGRGALGSDAAQPLFRGCDANAAFADLFAAADTDGSGALEDSEARPVRRGPPPEHWAVLALVYDADDSGDLSDAERQALLDDFTARCEVLTERVIAEFDADGDGALSAEEQATAEAALADRHEECTGGGPPPGDAPTDGERPPPPDAASGDVPPPLLDAFDADGSGDLDTSELDTLRTTVRARIRSGEPPGPPR